MAWNQSSFFFKKCLSPTPTDLPKQVPVITGIQSRYTNGDTIQANCTSFNSKPAANLTWLINDVPVGLFLINCCSEYVVLLKNKYFQTYLLQTVEYSELKDNYINIFHYENTYCITAVAAACKWIPFHKISMLFFFHSGHKWAEKWA